MSKKLIAEKGYRIPRIEEFVQGFKFEVDRNILEPTSEFTSKGRSGFFKKFEGREWEEIEVYWKPPIEKVLRGNGIVDKECVEETIEGTFIGTTIQDCTDEFEPFSIEYYLNRGFIRVKDNG